MNPDPSKFSKVFVTYDLDCEGEVKPALERIGLISGTDFCSVGTKTAGCENIEGLIPARIKQVVYAAKHDLVTAQMSQDSKIRNSAKQQLKMELLKEFKKARVADKELSEFKKLFSTIRAAF